MANCNNCHAISKETRAQISCALRRDVSEMESWLLAVVRGEEQAYNLKVAWERLKKNLDRQLKENS